MAQMNQKGSISEQIADFALSMKLEDVPEQIRQYGKMLLLDTFGVAMSCQNLEHAKAVRAAVMEMGEAKQCSLWGTDEKAQLSDAILYNSCLIHGADYDDTHVGSIVHPSAAIVSTALTVGEAVGATGRQMYEAIIAGWEIIVRLGLASKGRFHDVGYHGTGIVAPFAAACVAAKLMGLSKEVLVNALGICGSQAAALQEFLHDGAWTKKIHPGWGGHSAIYALAMAKHGFTGPKEVFEGGFGLWKTHLGDVDGLQEEMDDLGKVWHTPEITFKLYPVCHMTHSFIDCVVELEKEYGLKFEDIESIECRIEPRCYHIVCDPREVKTRPETDYMMRFSLPYVVAVAAKYQRVSPWEIDLKYAKDPEIMSMMDRVTCIADEEKRNPGYFPGWVKITDKQGSTYIKDHRYEKGTAQNPVDMERVQAKFEENLEPFYSAAQREKIAQAVKRIDELNNAAELISCLKVETK